MKIYTRTGDRGSTGLIGGRRVRKTHPRIEACGAADELNSFLGDALAVMPRGRSYAPLRRDLLEIQAELFAIGARIASPGKRSLPQTSETSRLEARIDAMTKDLPPLRSFILPGGLEKNNHGFLPFPYILYRIPGSRVKQFRGLFRAGFIHDPF